MIGLLQRVSEAYVSVDGREIARIASGLLVLVGVQRQDSAAQAERLLERLLTYRVWPDEAGKMNRSLRDTGGGLLLVPQFTIAADTTNGTRASFTAAADPGTARTLFAHLVDRAREVYPVVGAGQFGADMKVGSINDGPVTFWLTA
jgi:D-tyrosyl-tRNA(Tyr) deacylase